MPNYYEIKKKVYGEIDRMYSEGKSVDEILFKISTEYGFGEKIIIERVELLKRLTEENLKKKQKKN